MEIYKTIFACLMIIIFFASCTITQEGKGYNLIMKNEYAKALPYFEKSALAGSKEAAITAGWIYMQNHQVKRDITKAKYYYDMYLRMPAEANEQLYTTRANMLHAYLMLHDDDTSNDSEASAIFRSDNNMNDPFVLSILANIYAFGVGESKNIATAKMLYERAIKYDKSIMSLNDYAWLLSTHPDPNCRDAKLALELMQKVRQKKNPLISPSILDTLAAVYAENNMFKDAVDTQIIAINKLDEYAKKDDIDKIRLDFDCRLLSYKKGRAWHLEKNFAPFHDGQAVKCDF
ncbi:MAG: hypothetical protein Q7U16_02610 [Agitococcus sp.]|nr:hypothetical protein [Agitococcus sp.]